MPTGNRGNGSNRSNRSDQSDAPRAGVDPAMRRLTARERSQLDGLDSVQDLVNMLRCFGYSLDDMRWNPETNVPAYPIEVQMQMDSLKNGSLCAFSRLTPEITGMLVLMHDLSEQALNYKYFRIVRTYPDESKVLVDVTPAGNAPHHVRHVKVHMSKITTMYYPPNNDALNVRSCLKATNRDAAFKAAGYDPVNVQCLQVRPHPAIEERLLFRDLPRLLETLNRERAPGYPFKIQFGFQIFAVGEQEAVTEHLTNRAMNYESVYSTEPYMVLVDNKGSFIDVAPDIGASAHTPQAEAFQKLFIADDRFSYQTWSNLLYATLEYVNWGWMPTAPHMEEMGDGDTAVSLGMIPDDLNRAWRAQLRGGLLVRPFMDSCLTATKSKKELINLPIVKLRKDVVGGAMMMSANLAAVLAQQHARDFTMGGGMIMVRDKLGTICFACYTRITVAESKLCGGCGKARYCSAVCQKWHWSEHRTKCASPEERTVYRARREAAAREHADLVRNRDERAAREAAEAAAKEAARKAQIARERATRLEKQAADVAERVRRAAPVPPRSAKKGKRPTRSTEQLLVHAAWDSNNERAARTAAFMAKQEAEHLEAEARKATEKLQGMKDLVARVSMEEEARNHCVPCAPTMGAFM